MYFIHKNGNQLGPFSLEELKGKELKKDTMVWTEGFEYWKEAGTVSELNFLFQIQSPPPLIQTPPQIQTLNNEYPKENKLKIPIIIGVVLFILCIISFGIYKYYTNSNSNSSSDSYETRKEEPKRNEKTEIETPQELMQGEKPQEAYVNPSSGNQVNNNQVNNNNEILRNNWYKYITAKVSSFKAQALGGLYDINIIVENQIGYEVQNMEIIVTYILANGTNFKYEVLKLGSLSYSPGDAVLMSAPSSARGTKVICTIHKFKCNAIGLNYDNTSWD